jgi:acyl-coenzyme A synthetase/AMP-(fatty) acid ligase
VDTWWQTETGGFLCSTLPAITPMKPGSAGPGMPGIHPIIYDDEGNVVPRGAGKAGNICIQNPWPGMFRPSGATGTVSWTPTLPVTARIPKAPTGGTGPI